MNSVAKCEWTELELDDLDQVSGGKPTVGDAWSGVTAYQAAVDYAVHSLAPAGAKLGAYDLTRTVGGTGMGVIVDGVEHGVPQTWGDWLSGGIKTAIDVGVPALGTVFAGPAGAAGGTALTLALDKSIGYAADSAASYLTGTNVHRYDDGNNYEGAIAHDVFGPSHPDPGQIGSADTSGTGGGNGFGNNGAGDPHSAPDFGHAPDQGPGQFGSADTSGTGGGNGFGNNGAGDPHSTPDFGHAPDQGPDQGQFGSADTSGTGGGNGFGNNGAGDPSSAPDFGHADSGIGSATSGDVGHADSGFGSADTSGTGGGNGFGNNGAGDPSSAPDFGSAPSGASPDVPMASNDVGGGGGDFGGGGGDGGGGFA